MSAISTTPVDHLDRLMGPYGLFEHAEWTRPREEHGYCTDDNARLLMVTTRLSCASAAPLADDAATVARLGALALDFVLAAIDQDGCVHNRRDAAGCWTDDAGTDDCWGRATWGLGVTAAQHPDDGVRVAALRGFESVARQRSRSPRAMAFASLGAAEVLAVAPRHRAARTLLLQVLSTIPPVPSGDWTWPEPRLAYANAALAEALIAAGEAVNSRGDVDRGVRMLRWLLARELRAGHLSLTPAGGAGPDDHGPAFDQQPIEAAALADACARAHAVTGDEDWLVGVEAAVRWFAGDNDAGLPLGDPVTGGCADGLHRSGVNGNQGAESTLAFVGTMALATSTVLAPLLAPLRTAVVTAS